MSASLGMPTAVPWARSQRTAPETASCSVVRSSPSVVRAATPVEAVVVYVEALYRKDYGTAYGCLSADSQEAHPYEGFLARAETGEATNFDLAAAQAGEEVAGRVIVRVPLVEDPAEAGFTTVREGGNWRVVFIGGEPWFPYPEEPSRAGSESVTG